MNVTGKLVEIFEIIKVKETFQKREFVLEYTTNPKYPELIKFEAVQDKCSLLDGFRVGQDVSVDFDLRGRKWTDQKGAVKYFNTLQAWRMSAADGSADSVSAKQAGPNEEDTEDPGTDKDGGLPF
ncbi:MAG: DUF3127 domain-containing protein [bacterium]